MRSELDEARAKLNLEREEMRVKLDAKTSELDEVLRRRQSEIEASCDRRVEGAKETYEEYKRKCDAQVSDHRARINSLLETEREGMKAQVQALQAQLTQEHDRAQELIRSGQQELMELQQAEFSKRAEFEGALSKAKDEAMESHNALLEETRNELSAARQALQQAQLERDRDIAEAIAGEREQANQRELQLQSCLGSDRQSALAVIKEQYSAQANEYRRETEALRLELEEALTQYQAESDAQAKLHSTHLAQVEATLHKQHSQAMATLKQDAEARTAMLRTDADRELSKQALLHEQRMVTEMQDKQRQLNALRERADTADRVLYDRLREKDAEIALNEQRVRREAEEERKTREEQREADAAQFRCSVFAEVDAQLSAMRDSHAEAMEAERRSHQEALLALQAQAQEREEAASAAHREREAMATAQRQAERERDREEMQREAAAKESALRSEVDATISAMRDTERQLRDTIRAEAAAAQAQIRQREAEREREAERALEAARVQLASEQAALEADYQKKVDAAKTAADARVETLVATHTAALEAVEARAEAAAEAAAAETQRLVSEWEGQKQDLLSKAEARIDALTHDHSLAIDQLTTQLSQVRLDAKADVHTQVMAARDGLEQERLEYEQTVRKRVEEAVKQAEETAQRANDRHLRQVREREREVEREKEELRRDCERRVEAQVAASKRDVERALSSVQGEVETLVQQKSADLDAAYAAREATLLETHKRRETALAESHASLVEGVLAQREAVDVQMREREAELRSELEATAAKTEAALRARLDAVLVEREAALEAGMAVRVEGLEADRRDMDAARLAYAAKVDEEARQREAQWMAATAAEAAARENKAEAEAAERQEAERVTEAEREAEREALLSECNTRIEEVKALSLKQIETEREANDKRIQREVDSLAEAQVKLAEGCEVERQALLASHRDSMASLRVQLQAEAQQEREAERDRMAKSEEAERERQAEAASKFAAERELLSSQHSESLNRERESHSAAVEALVADQAAKLKVVEDAHSEKVSVLAAQHQQASEALRADLAQALEAQTHAFEAQAQQAQAAHDELLKQYHAAEEERLAAVRAESASLLEQRQQAMDAQVEEARQAAAAEIKAREAALEAERAVLLAGEGERETRRAEAEAEREVALRTQLDQMYETRRLQLQSELEAERLVLFKERNEAVEASREEHERRESALRVEHTQALAKRTAQHQEALSSLRVELDREREAAQAAVEAERVAMAEETRAVLQREREAFAVQTDKVAETHARALSEMGAVHEAEREVLRERLLLLEGDITDLHSAHAQALLTVRAEADAERDALVASHASDMAAQGDRYEAMRLAGLEAVARERQSVERERLEYESSIRAKYDSLLDSERQALADTSKARADEVAQGWAAAQQYVAEQEEARKAEAAEREAAVRKECDAQLVQRDAEHRETLAQLKDSLAEEAQAVQAEARQSVERAKAAQTEAEAQVRERYNTLIAHERQALDATLAEATAAAEEEREKLIAAHDAAVAEVRLSVVKQEEEVKARYAAAIADAEADMAVRMGVREEALRNEHIAMEERERERIRALEVSRIEFSERVQAQYAALMANQQTHHQEERAEANRTLERQLATLTASHENELHGVRMQSQTEVERVRGQCQAKVDAERQASQDSLQERMAAEAKEWERREREREEREAEGERQRLVYEADIRAKAEATVELVRRDMAAQMDALKAQLAQEASQAERERAKAMERARDELEERETRLRLELAEKLGEHRAEGEALVQAAKQRYQGEMDTLRQQHSDALHLVETERVSYEAEVRDRYAAQGVELERTYRQQTAARVSAAEVTANRRVEEADARLAALAATHAADLQATLDTCAADMAAERQNSATHLERVREGHAAATATLKEQLAARLLETQAECEGVIAGVRAETQAAVHDAEARFTVRHAEREAQLETERQRLVAEGLALRQQVHAEREGMAASYKAKFDDLAEKQLNDHNALVTDLHSQWDAKEAELSEALRTSQAETRMAATAAEERERERYEGMLAQFQASLTAETEARLSRAKAEAATQAASDRQALVTKLEEEKQAFSTETAEEFARRDRDRDAHWASHVDGIHSHYKTLLAEAATAAAATEAERQKERLDFEASTRATADAQVSALVLAHNEALARVESECNARVEELAETHKTELAAKEARLLGAQQSLIDKHDALAVSLREEVEGERETLNVEHRERAALLLTARKEYEANVRARYEQLAVSIRADADLAVREAEQRADDAKMQAEASIARYECTVRDQIQSEVREREAELAKVIEMERETVKRDAAAREEQWLQRQADLDGSIQAARQAIEQSAKEQIDAARAAMRSDVEHLEGQIVTLNEQLTAEANERLSAEQALRKANHTSLVWKADFTRATREKYQTLVSSLESRLLKEQEDLRVALLGKEEMQLSVSAVRLEAEDTLKQTVAAITAEREAEQEERDRVAAEAKAEEEDRAGRLYDLRTKLKELWQVLETEPEEVSAFLSGLAAHVDTTPEVLTKCEMEVSRLNEILPIFELVSRRQFTLARLREFSVGATDPERLFSGNSTRLMGEDRERGEIQAELTKVNTLLVPAVRAYEAKHGRVFKFRGKPYLEVLGRDVREIEREAALDQRNRQSRGSSLRATPGPRMSGKDSLRME
ncbi:hypothetical protein KIPB_004971 [Kipferlia bialata]|uniref:Uncharacterized protein n=1 Tax=Kipferlia bialata TaxID=797122 RepID=A0A9K3GIP1_9EUKA|nr:hypothetical protein KIPB_004971 [Kipferlia bialata]|eukprot:g4971.t1